MDSQVWSRSAQYPQIATLYEMLDVAQGKDANRDIEFARADMRELPVQLGAFDVVTWIGDVANHLLTIDDLCSAWKVAWRGWHQVDS